MSDRELTSLVINSITALAAAALGLFGGFWVYEKGRTDRERAKHLADLKEQVLEPMLTYLRAKSSQFWHHLGNVGICNARVSRQNASIMQPSVEIEEGLCYRVVSPDVAAALSDTAGGKEVPAFLGNPLYTHARQHFSDLFNTWDALDQGYQGYYTACYRYADYLKSEFEGTILITRVQRLATDTLGASKQTRAAHYVQTVWDMDNAATSPTKG